MPSLPKWVAILNGDLTDSRKSHDQLQACCGDILNFSNKTGVESDTNILTYVDSIQNCLRKILQFWSKAPHNDQYQWSPCSLVLAAALLNLMSHKNDEEFPKCYKLTGFVLAKLSSMGEVGVAHI